MPVYEKISAMRDSNVSEPVPAGNVLISTGGLWTSTPAAALMTAGNAALASGGGVEKVFTVSIATAGDAPYTVTLANGNVFSLKFTNSGKTTFTFAGAAAAKACSFTLYLIQPATGATRTFAWPAGTKWSGGAPALSASGSKTDILVFETINGGTTWYGSLVGTNFV